MFNPFRLTESIKLSRDFKIICFYQTIIALANGMMTLFLPIFLLQEFNNSAYWVIIFYIAGYFAYAMLVPFGAMIMSRIGLKTSMLVGRVFVIIFYISLYFFHNNPLFFAVLANVNLLIFRLFYWVPYQVDFTKFTDGKYRGRQMSYLAILGYIVGIGAPLLSGLLLSQYSFDVLFVITIIILALAMIPLSKINKTEAEFEFSYLQTFKELFKKKNHHSGVAYFADGAQSMVGIVIWPIFIYQILQGQYLAVGAVTSLIVVGTIIFQLLMGRYTDKFSKRKLMKIGSSFYALGWLAKAFIVTAFQIFIVGTFHQFMAIILRTPFDALRYEEFADTGSYVDEYTVLREISIALGRTLMGLLLIILISLFGFQIAFILAALVSLFVNML